MIDAPKIPWAAILAGVLVLVVLLIGIGAYRGWISAPKEIAQSQAQTQVATGRAEGAKEAVKTIDQHNITIRQIQERSDATQTAIQTAPDLAAADAVAARAMCLFAPPPGGVGCPPATLSGSNPR